MQMKMVECRCSNGHLIIGAAAPMMLGDEKLVEILQGLVNKGLQSGKVNSWCGQCGCGSEGWKISISEGQVDELFGDITQELTAAIKIALKDQLHTFTEDQKHEILDNLLMEHLSQQLRKARNN